MDYLFYTYFDTPPQLFHQIQKMTIFLSYKLTKWKYGENSEKSEGGCQNTCKNSMIEAKVQTSLVFLILLFGLGGNSTGELLLKRFFGVFRIFSLF